MITFLRWVWCDDSITYNNLTLADLKPIGACLLIGLPVLPPWIAFLTNL